jgi:hypothetical protein
MRYGGSEMRGFLLGAIASGCCVGGAPPVPPAMSPAPAPTTAPTPPSTAIRPEPGPTRTLRVSPIEPASSGGGPSLQIVRPTPDQRVPAAAATSLSVEVRVEHGDPEHPVLFALDGGRPRAVPASGVLLLPDLLPADARIEVGPHRLLAVATDASGLALREKGSFASVSFFVGGAQSPAGRAPSALFCLSPVGTHYGADAEELTLDVLAVSKVDAPLSLWIEGPGLRQTLPFDPDQAYRIAGLSAGDHRFVVEGGGRVLCECTTTLNPEIGEDGAP